MKLSARNKILIILSFFLLLFLGGLGYWYFSYGRCVKLPQEYSFLDRFLVTDKCTEKEYRVKGIMYNIREEEENILFDFNAWDTENRESLYYEDIELDGRSCGGDFSVKEGNWGVIEVFLRIYPSKHKFDFSSKEYKYDIAMDHLSLSKEEYKEIYTSIYTGINNTIVKEDPELEESSLREKNIVVTRIKTAGERYLAYLDDGFTNDRLYRPWILSYPNYHKEGIQSDDERRMEIIEMLNFDFEDFMLELGELAPEDYKEDLNEIETADSYEESNSFACLMILQISENIGPLPEHTLNKYCDIDYFSSSIENLLSNDPKDNLTTKDLKLISQWYSNILTVDLLQSSQEDSDMELHNPNISSLPGDVFAVQRLYSDSKSSQEDIFYFALEYILSRGDLYLKDICSLYYYINLLGEEDDLLEDYSLIKERTEEIFNPISTELLQILEKDLYSSTLCFESFNLNDEYKRNLTKLYITKVFYLNFAYGEKGNYMGIWNDRGEYDIKTDARFLKLLKLYLGNSL